MELVREGHRVPRWPRPARFPRLRRRPDPVDRQLSRLGRTNAAANSAGEEPRSVLVKVSFIRTDRGSSYRGGQGRRRDEPSRPGTRPIDVLRPGLKRFPPDAWTGPAAKTRPADTASR